MNALYRFREEIKDLYARYDLYFRLVLKFGLALLTYIGINSQLGYLPALNNLLVLVVLAAVSTILPTNGIVVIGIALIIAHSIGLTMIMGLVAAVIYTLMLLLYFRFVPDDALVMVLTPVAFTFHVPLAVPMVLGLVGRPVSVVSVIMGIVSWRFCSVLSTTIAPMVHGGSTSMEDLIEIFGQNFLTRETILIMIVSLVVLIICAAIRQLLNFHSWTIAIIVGTVVYLVLMMAGGTILEAEVDMVQTAVGALIAMAVSFVLEFFLFSADYSGTELLQFEDDRYYYKVRVIPKTMVSTRKSRRERMEQELEYEDVNPYETRTRVMEERLRQDLREGEDQHPAREDRRRSEAHQPNSYKSERPDFGNTRVVDRRNPLDEKPDGRQDEGLDDTRVFSRGNGLGDTGTIDSEELKERLRKTFGSDDK